MNIPDEVIRDAQTALYLDHISDHWGETVPEIDDVCAAAVLIVAPVIAEWARKEERARIGAIVTRASVVREGVVCVDTGTVTRALAEGDTDA